MAYVQVNQLRKQPLDGQTSPQDEASVPIEDGPLDEIAFLYKLEEGAAGGSFGAFCAERAGIGKEVIERAKHVSSCFLKNEVSYM